MKVSVWEKTHADSPVDIYKAIDIHAHIYSGQIRPPLDSGKPFGFADNDRRLYNRYYLRATKEAYEHPELDIEEIHRR